MVDLIQLEEEGVDLLEAEVVNMVQLEEEDHEEVVGDEKRVLLEAEEVD